MIYQKKFALTDPVLLEAEVHCEEIDGCDHLPRKALFCSPHH